MLVPDIFAPGTCWRPTCSRPVHVCTRPCPPSRFRPQGPRSTSCTHHCIRTHFPDDVAVQVATNVDKGSQMHHGGQSTPILSLSSGRERSIGRAGGRAARPTDNPEYGVGLQKEGRVVDKIRVLRGVLGFLGIDHQDGFVCGFGVGEGDAHPGGALWGRKSKGSSRVEEGRGDRA
jgi:hypothetical protein